MNIDLEKAIRMSVDTGKVEFGTKTCKNLAAHGKTKLVLVAGNCPSALKKEINDLCKNSNVPCIEVKYPSIELGSLAGKPYPVLMMAVIEPGDSEILKLTE
jgi:large subunit ribosomal protein L30e